MDRTFLSLFVFKKILEHPVVLSHFLRRSVYGCVILGPTFLKLTQNEYQEPIGYRVIACRNSMFSTERVLCKRPQVESGVVAAMIGDFEGFESETGLA